MQTRKYFLRFCLFSVLFQANISSALTQDTPSEITVYPEVFNVTTDKNFSSYRQSVVDFLKSQHVHKTNNICILGEKYTDGTKSAWIIWNEGKKLILWDGGDEPLSISRRILNLNKDVVSDETDINGSNYLVTRSWVRKLKKRCDKHGTKITISKSELKPIKNKK